MAISCATHRINTSHGSMAVEDNGRGGTPLVSIHGNSSSRAVFIRQACSRLAERHRIISFDLPGHGESGNAPDPMRSYTLPGLADGVVELLTDLGIEEAVVLGWSLGGHIGIEMLPRFPGVKGLIITGTPPVRPGALAEGFVASPSTGLAGRKHLSEIEIDQFGRAMFGEPVPSFLRGAIGRADGRFRERLFEAARAGEGLDQRVTVENSKVPIAVINGSDYPLIKLDYVDGIAFGNLWRGQCRRLSAIGHAPFWHAADEFNAILECFLNDVTARPQAAISRPPSDNSKTMV